MLLDICNVRRYIAESAVAKPWRYPIRHRVIFASALEWNIYGFVFFFPLSHRLIKKIQASYTLEGTDLENVESIKYLGVTITSDLRWNTHVSNVCTKANRTLGFLRRNLYSCHQEVKEAAYKGLVRPVRDYGSSVWDPPGVVLQEELESVQKRAARFATGNYNYETGSMTGILGQLKWESLKKRRKDNRHIAI